jgi:hypothetical protein
MAKKVNPKRVLASGADVKKALHEGIDVGCNQAVKMIMYILLDKHGMPLEDVQKVADELSWLASRIAEGRISWSFVDTVLKENHLEVRIR